MGLFTKKNKYEPSSNNDLLYDFFEMDDTPENGDNKEDTRPPITSWADKAARIKAPHAITAEEIISDSINPAPEHSAEPEASLFERVVKKATEKPADSVSSDDIIVKPFEEPLVDNIIMEPVAPSTTQNKPSTEADSAIKSLLEKCSSYIDDIDNPNDITNVEINLPSGTDDGESVDDIILAAEQRANDRVKAKYGEINLSEDIEDTHPEDTSNKKREIPVDYTVLTPGDEEPIIVSKELPTTPETIVMEPIREETEIKESLDSTRVIDLSGTSNVVTEAPAKEVTADGLDLDITGGTIAFTPPQDTGTDITATRQVSIGGEVEDIFSNTDKSINSISNEEYIEEDEQEPETIEPPVNEYTSLSDAAEIKTELLKSKKSSAVKITVSAIVTALSLIFSIPSVCAAISLTGTALAVFHLVMLAVLTAANIKTACSVFALTRGTRSFDSVVSISVLSVVIHAVAMVATGSHDPLFLTSAAGAVLLFNEMGHYRKTAGILTGFAQIASSDKKKCVYMFDNDKTALGIAGETIDGDVLLAASGTTVNIDDYIKNSYSPTPADKNSLKILSVAIIAAVVATAITFSLTSSISTSLTVLPLVLCLAGGLPLTFTVGSLLSTLANTVSKKCGGMVAGYHAIERFSECNAVALDATDIFPRGTVISNDMRIISMNKVDKTLTNSVALSIKAGSPISGMLKTLLGGDIKTFPTVDSCKYENGMGISGWVDDSFMLIGNRDLMTAHNIKLPSVSVDNKILKAGFFPIYIACDETACALLIVSYHPNEHVAFDLRNACKIGLSVFVKSTDPNINARMISDYFGVYDDFVTVLNKRGASALDENTKHSERCSSLASFRGSSHSLLKIINASCSIRKSITILTVIAAVLAGVGVISAVYSSATALFPVIAAAIVPAVHFVYWAVNKIVAALNKKIH